MKRDAANYGKSSLLAVGFSIWVLVLHAVQTDQAPAPQTKEGFREATCVLCGKTYHRQDVFKLIENCSTCELDVCSVTQQLITSIERFNELLKYQPENREAEDSLQDCTARLDLHICECERCLAAFRY